MTEKELVQLCKLGESISLPQSKNLLPKGRLWNYFSLPKRTSNYPKRTSNYPKGGTKIKEYELYNKIINEQLVTPAD